MQAVGRGRVRSTEWVRKLECILVPAKSRTSSQGTEVISFLRLAL